MPLLNGFEAARRIQTQAPNVKFVFLTMHEDPNLAAAAVQLGPVAFILKNSSVRELLEAIEQVLHGRSYMTPKLKAADWVEAKARVRQFSRDLTKRQCDVLQLFAEGRAMKDIGSILKLSTKTVEFHKYRIMRAFNVRSNADLVLFALGLGLIDVEADPKLALKAPSY
jgi:DNA-binding NarL/FixJ family response regulator